MITLKFIENPIAIESATSILPKGAAFEIATGKKKLIVAVDDEKNVFQDYFAMNYMRSLAR